MERPDKLIQSSNKKGSHRVAFSPTHHLSVVEPLWSEHLVEPSQRKLPFFENPREPASCKATQAPLEPQLMLLLGSELPPPEGTYHRAPAAPPRMGMSWWTRNTAPLVWCLTPAQLRKETRRSSGVWRGFVEKAGDFDDFIKFLVFMFRKQLWKC